MDYWKLREIIVKEFTYVKLKDFGTFGSYFNPSEYGGFYGGSSNLVGNSLINLDQTPKYTFTYNKTSYYDKLFATYFSRPSYTKPCTPTYTQATFTSTTNTPTTRGNFDLTPVKRTVGTPLKLTPPTDYIKNFEDLTALGYNQSKGQKLFNDAYRHMDGHWKEHDCKTHVREASERCGLGTITGENGVKSLASLRQNPNYREVSASSIDVNNIPAGTIGIFNPGSQGYNPKHGHTEIYGYVNGKLKGISNWVTNNVKKADYYFIPV